MTAQTIDPPAAPWRPGDPTPRLNAAIAAFQAELPEIRKDERADVPTKTGGSYSYRYANLATVSKIGMPPLGKHGLAFVALPGLNAEGRFGLSYSLRHESGEELCGFYPLSAGTPQAIGGEITYARRYTLQAALGLAPAEDDDDAHEAETQARNRIASGRPASAAEAFANAAPVSPRGQQQRPAGPAVQVPPLADDDPWKAKIDDIADRDEAADVYAEVAELRKAGSIDDARAARLGSAITARVANLGLAAQNGTAASTAPPAQAQTPGRIRQEDQGAPAPAAPAPPADGAREAAGAEWVRGFMARLADVPDLGKVLPMQREIGQAVQARTITPETGGEMAKACRARANELETAAKAA